METITIAPERRKELIEAQRRYCEETRQPHFAPNDGVCWGCGQDMVDESWAGGLVTGCRICHKSYCD